MERIVIKLSVLTAKLLAVYGCVLTLEVLEVQSYIAYALVGFAVGSVRLFEFK